MVNTICECWKVITQENSPTVGAILEISKTTRAEFCDLWYCHTDNFMDPDNAQIVQLHMLLIHFENYCPVSLIMSHRVSKKTQTPSGTITARSICNSSDLVVPRPRGTSTSCHLSNSKARFPTLTELSRNVSEISTIWLMQSSTYNNVYFLLNAAIVSKSFNQITGNIILI